LCDWTYNPASDPAPAEVICDFRNNLVWGYGWTGTSVRRNGTANIVNNYYYTALPLPYSPGPSDADHALYVIEGGIAYASGNYSPVGLNIDAQGNRATPFPAVAFTTTDALTAAQQIVAQAGARGPNFGLDSADLNSIGQISLSR
jgi:hypothetical protein